MQRGSRTGETSSSPGDAHFAARTPIPRFYQTHLGERHYASGKVAVVLFARLCEELVLP